MIIKIAASFERVAKKFHRNQISQLEDAIDELAKNPELGELKNGDLASIRVYKFRINNQLMLLAYQYDEIKKEITLLSIGVHENFYRDLKNK